MTKDKATKCITDEFGIPIKGVISVNNFVYPLTGNPISGEMLTMVQKRSYSFTHNSKDLYCDVTIDEFRFHVEVYELPQGILTTNEQNFTQRVAVQLTEPQCEELSLRIARALESEGA